MGFLKGFTEGRVLLGLLFFRAPHQSTDRCSGCQVNISCNVDLQQVGLFVCQQPGDSGQCRKETQSQQASACSQFEKVNAAVVWQNGQQVIKQNFTAVPSD